MIKTERGSGVICLNGAAGSFGVGGRRYYYEAIRGSKKKLAYLKPAVIFPDTYKLTD